MQEASSVRGVAARIWHPHEGMLQQLGVDDKHFRALRLWHWDEFERCRELEYHKNSSAASRKKWNALATRHMIAVQTLNDLFALGDTAQGDSDRRFAITPT